MLSDENASRPGAGRYDPFVRPDAGALAGTDGDPAVFGELRVRAQTAHGALPVAGARVTVTRCGDGEVAGSCVTDESGLSRTFTLPTERISAVSPGEAPPCARYDVEVLAEGFERAEFCGVPVYEGVTSIQCAVLVPLIAGRSAAAWRRRFGAGRFAAESRGDDRAADRSAEDRGGLADE